jgi:CRISPR-associated protein Csd2
MTTPAYCDPTKRHDFLFVFDVLDGNPNGDPDAGNLPRVDPQSMHGIVTDVAIKRKVRDYVAGMCGKLLYIQNRTALNTLYREEAKDVPEAKGLFIEVHVDDTKVKELLKVTNAQDADENVTAFREWLEGIASDDVEYDPLAEKITYSGDAGKPKDIQDSLRGGRELAKNDPENTYINALVVALTSQKKKVKLTREARDAVKSRMCERFWDIRMFGAVLTAGTNAGQVRGPMQLTFSRSLHPVTPLDPTITRIAITKPADMLRKQTEMGRKPYVPFARYRGYGFFNPFLAEMSQELARSGAVGKKVGKDTEDDVCGRRTVGKTYVTEGDLKAFWEAFEDSRMFREAKSASNGRMIVRSVYIFTHSDPKGDVASHKLFEIVERNMGGLREQNKDRPDGPDDYVALPTCATVQEACDRFGTGKITVKVLCLDDEDTQHPKP